MVTETFPRSNTLSTLVAKNGSRRWCLSSLNRLGGHGSRWLLLSLRLLHVALNRRRFGCIRDVRCSIGFITLRCLNGIVDGFRRFDCHTSNGTGNFQSLCDIVHVLFQPMCGRQNGGVGDFVEVIWAKLHPFTIPGELSLFLCTIVEDK